MDVCELYFLDMVKFWWYRRKEPEEELNFSLENPLHRWLMYFDDNSLSELVDELVKMENTILMAQTKL